jgi:hypothetical protein
MKIYVKELGKDEENIQILNTSTDKFFMPRVGDNVLVSYTVVKVEWISFRSGNETAVLWVIKRKDNLVKVSVIERIRSGVWKSNDKEVLLVETSIERTQLPEALVPRIGEKMEVDGKVYEVLEVVKVGSLFNFGELKVVVHELS